MTQFILTPDALWPAIRERSRQALAQGALQPIQTRTEIIEDHGLAFRVSIATALIRKDAALRQEQAAAVNPFLPPEAALLVGRISSTHLAVLNKYNVVEDHALVVTERFEHQETLLTRADFDALRTCLAGHEALGLHNAGTGAGASQMHKHLQALPLPFGDSGPRVPIEALLADAPDDTAVRCLPRLTFAHAFTRLPPAASGDDLHERYRQLLANIGITEILADGVRRQSAPYNLLVTRRWMLLVPRTRERFEGVSLNAVAFAGSLFVRDADQLQRLKEHGPMAALRAVTLP